MNDVLVSIFDRINPKLLVTISKQWNIYAKDKLLKLLLRRSENSNNSSTILLLVINNNTNNATNTYNRTFMIANIVNMYGSLYVSELCRLIFNNDDNTHICTSIRNSMISSNKNDLYEYMKNFVYTYHNVDRNIMYGDDVNSIHNYSNTKITTFHTKKSVLNMYVSECIRLGIGIVYAYRALYAYMKSVRSILSNKEYEIYDIT